MILRIPVRNVLLSMPCLLTKNRVLIRPLLILTVLRLRCTQASTVPTALPDITSATMYALPSPLIRFLRVVSAVTQSIKRNASSVPAATTWPKTKNAIKLMMEAMEEQMELELSRPSWWCYSPYFGFNLINEILIPYYIIFNFLLFLNLN